MGIELELSVLLAIAIVGPAIFAVFEVETPWWRKALKWTLISAITLAFYAVAGHWAVLFPVAGALAGLGFHFWWCRKQGIDPLRATPRRRYYELRGWEWRG
jgi:hypothetical protein